MSGSDFGVSVTQAALLQAFPCFPFPASMCLGTSSSYDLKCWRLNWCSNRPGGFFVKMFYALTGFLLTHIGSSDFLHRPGDLTEFYFAICPFQVSKLIGIKLFIMSFHLP